MVIVHYVVVLLVQEIVLNNMDIRETVKNLKKERIGTDVIMMLDLIDGVVKEKSRYYYIFFYKKGDDILFFIKKDRDIIINQDKILLSIKESTGKLLSDDNIKKVIKLSLNIDIQRILLVPDKDMVSNYLEFRIY